MADYPADHLRSDSAGFASSRGVNRSPYASPKGTDQGRKLNAISSGRKSRMTDRVSSYRRSGEATKRSNTANGKSRRYSDYSDSDYSDSQVKSQSKGNNYNNKSDFKGDNRDGDLVVVAVTNGDDLSPGDRNESTSKSKSKSKSNKALEVGTKKLNKNDGNFPNLAKRISFDGDGNRSNDFDAQGNESEGEIVGDRGLNEGYRGERGGGKSDTVGRGQDQLTPVGIAGKKSSGSGGSGSDGSGGSGGGGSGSGSGGSGSGGSGSGGSGSGGSGSRGSGSNTRNNNNTRHTSAAGPRKSSPVASSPRSRVQTPRGQGRHYPDDSGFDNSDKNKTRQNLGSSTDQVAGERPKFGAWQEPNLERQTRLVERLAPYRPPAPPDPRFNYWVNHFEYYLKIGVNEKQTRKRLEDSLRSNNYRTYYNDGDGGGDGDVGGGGVNGLSTKSTSSFHSGYPRGLSRNRLLSGRPRTTPGRVGTRNSQRENSDNNNNNTNNNSYTSNNINGMESSRKTPRMTKSSIGYRSGHVMTSSEHSRKAERSRSDGQLLESIPTVPGLDRRYMGLQSVRGEELRDIVGRLTRMTSAYHAKFAPNPHVWCDNSPGAHMVIKRENTMA